MGLLRPARAATALLIGAATAFTIAVPATAAELPPEAEGHTPTPNDMEPRDKLQTRVVSDFWGVVTPLFDIDNPADDPSFYTVPEGFDFAGTKPGDVLRERMVKYHIANIPTPVDVTQVLYVTTNARGELEESVTSIVHPPGGVRGAALSYQSIYDSLNPKDNPSRIIAGNITIGGTAVEGEAALITPALLNGHPVIIPDFEGKDSNFSAGPSAGFSTLDSLRAASHTESAPIDDSTPLTMFGFSGGTIGTGWAGAVAREYAPEINDRIIGAALAGVFVNPSNNFNYVEHAPLWSGVAGMSLVGLARANDVDLSPYLNDYGNAILEDLKNLSIVQAIARYPEFSWDEIRAYDAPRPTDIPVIREMLEKSNLGGSPAPDYPLFVRQAYNGALEGTPEGGPGVGPGDGVMVRDDVRTLFRSYCEAGTPVNYGEYPYLSHTLSFLPGAIEGMSFLKQLDDGYPVNNTCASIPEGNDLTTK